MLWYEWRVGCFASCALTPRVPWPQVDIECYNAVLADCEGQNELSVALSVFGRMRNESVPPTYETYSILSRMLDSAGEYGVFPNPKP